MPSQKLENLLNLALSATEEERLHSLVLDIGYNPINREWDLIVKYTGSLDLVREISESVVELQNEYAIITIKELNIPLLAEIPEVEFVEKPKRLVEAVANGRRVSCITAVQASGSEELFGAGILIAFVDSGIDYTHPDFINADGTTRIRALWDQTTPGNPPAGYVIGTEYTQEQINEALKAPNRVAQLQLVPSEDISGHGTAVAGVAAGNGRASDGQYIGVAPQSELVVVKVGVPQREGFPRTVELMQGIDYVMKKSLEYQMPISINVSFGNNYGSHDGTSLLERYIDDMSNRGRSCICIGTGNEGGSAGHTSGVLVQGQEELIGLSVQENQPSLNVQIWKEYVDQVDISLISPTGVRVGPLQELLGPQRFIVGNTEILLYYGEPSPYSVAQEIFIDFIPAGNYINSGVWQIVLTPRKVVQGEYFLWLPSQVTLNGGTAFQFPQETLTLTIPSTAYRVVSVGAYNSLTYNYANFSGRGFTRRFDDVKPDIVAPGVNVIAPNTSGGYSEFSGTSFATPFVTGSAALLMEWGIIRKNDIYLYGEKVKAYLRRGASALPGYDTYPNPTVGFGALCLENSLPR